MNAHYSLLIIEEDDYDDDCDRQHDDNDGFSKSPRNLEIYS